MITLLKENWKNYWSGQSVELRDGYYFISDDIMGEETIVNKSNMIEFMIEEGDLLKCLVTKNYFTKYKLYKVERVNQYGDILVRNDGNSLEIILLSPIAIKDSTKWAIPTTDEIILYKKHVVIGDIIEHVLKNVSGIIIKFNDLGYPVIKICDDYETIIHDYYENNNWVKKNYAAN